MALIIAKKSMSTASSGMKHITVIGGGIMGSGIAQVAAQIGQNLTLVDVNEQVLDKSRNKINKSLQSISKKLYKDDPTKGDAFLKKAMGHLSFSNDLPATVKSTDLVIEAVVENLKVKQDIFSSIDSVAPESTIFVTNTSSLPVLEIGSVVKRTDRFAGMHFFNPVPIMKLVEVIRTPNTSDATFSSVVDWVKKMGKVPVACKDTPGFIVNRLSIPMFAEALRMVERGEATPEDIDIAMKFGASWPKGLFEVVDYVGLDTTKMILDGWHKKFPEEPLFKPLKTLNKLVSEGKFGVKSGEGFYKYSK